MFFVAKEKIGTVLGAQKEYTAATRRGIGFASHGNVWHYLWPSDQLEPSIRARFEPNVPVGEQPDAEDAEFATENAHLHGERPQGGPNHYLWSQGVAPGEIVGDPVINPYSGTGNWVEEAKQKFLAARQQ